MRPHLPTSRWGKPAALLALALLALLLSACGKASLALSVQRTPSPARPLPVQRTPSPRAHLRSGRPSHVAVIVMENEEYSNVIGSRSTPYIDSLARRYALAENMYAITHPSLPNYLALTGGSAFGINSDCSDCAVNASNLTDQFQREGLSWKAYMENLPRPCFSGSGAGEYAKKHDPFLYYRDIAAMPARCSRVVALSQLKADEAARRLPAFLWISPNLCHDMHDCDRTTGDRFLAGLVPPLLRSLGPTGLLFITWDEGTSDSACCRLASGGHIATILAGGGARGGARLQTPVDHYSVLQTIEDLLGLPRMRGAACVCTPSLQPLLAR